MLDFPLYYQLTRLYADYAAALDAEQWEQWPEFFLEDCVYKVLPRENHERGYPLATMSFESRGMLKDRIYGATDTIFTTPTTSVTWSAPRACCRFKATGSNRKPTTRCSAPSRTS